MIKPFPYNLPGYQGPPYDGVYVFVLANTIIWSAKGISNMVSWFYHLEKMTEVFDEDGQKRNINE